MIMEFEPASEFVQQQVQALRDEGMTSSIGVTIGRHESGVYQAQLVRVTTTPARIQGVSLGNLSDVPQGMRRCTWVLSEAVQRALYDGDAHTLLHW